MFSDPTESPLAALISSFVRAVHGFQSAKYLYIASLTALVYDHLLCLDREFAFFWNGSWSLTRVVYHINRFFPMLSFIVRAITLFDDHLTMDFCHWWTRFDYSLTIVAVFVVELVLVIRVYHLYEHSPISQFGIVASFLVTTAVTVILLALKLTTLTEIAGLDERLTAGCTDSLPSQFWDLFLPAFLLQTLLFGLTLYRVRSALRQGKKTPLIKCLIIDGTLFYLSSFLSLGFTGLGSILATNLEFSIPAILSNFLLSIMSIGASRLLLSIRTLAAQLDADPEFIFNEMEMTRIQGLGRVRQGAHKGEIYVDIENRPMQDRPASRMHRLPSDASAQTCVGKFGVQQADGWVRSDQEDMGR